MHADEDRPKPKPTHVVGQDLASLSVSDLDDRVAILKAEIERLEMARRSKLDGLSAADALFKF